MEYLKPKLAIVINKNMKIKLTLFIVFFANFLTAFSQCPSEIYKTIYPTGPTDPTIAVFPQSVYVGQNDVIYTFLYGGYDGSGVNFILRQNGFIKDTIQFGGNDLSKIRLDNNNQIHINVGNAIYKYSESSNTWAVVAGGGVSGSASNQLSDIVKDFYIDHNNNIYIADTQNNRVQKWLNGATSGITVAGGNGYGTGNNQTPFPSAIFLNSIGEIFVADNLNNRIQKWIEGQTSGVTVAGGNGQGAALNQFDRIESFVLNDNNEIFVADYNNHRIMKWLPSSSSGLLYLGGIGYGTTLNHISFPTTIALGNSGELFVSSDAKIIKIPSSYVLPNGNLNAISSLLNFGESTELHVSLIGNSPFNFKINDFSFNNISSNSFVYTITPGKNTTYTLKDMSDACGTVKSSGVVNVIVNNSLCTPEIFKLVSSNTITSDSIKFKDFSVWNNTEIYGIDNLESGGQYVQRIVKKNLNDISGLATEVISSFTLYNSGGTNPARIFVDVFKNIYLRYYDSGQIRKWSPPYTNSTVVVNNFGNNYESDFVVDSSGTVYGTRTCLCDNSIEKWVNNPNLPIIIIQGNGTGQGSLLKHPSGIILDKQNNLVIADKVDGSIKKIFTNTNTIVTLQSGLTLPSDVFINQNSEYFIVEGCDPLGYGTGSKRIRKFDKNGNFIMTIAENLNCPYNIGGDSTGKIIFRDLNNTYVYQPSFTMVLSKDTTITQGDSAKITLNFNGIGPFSFTMNDSLFNNINQNPFEIKVSPSISKTFTFEAFSSICGNGQILTDNVVEVIVIPCDAVAPILSNDSITIGNQVQINASGCINGTINWYDSQNSHEILFSGNTFISPILNSTKSYFASCQTSSCESSSRAESHISVFNCPENYSFILVSPNDSNYNAFKSIISSMPQNTNTIFSSGNYIELKPGFKTLVGNTFQAQIGGCP